jgi:hypothetical protein
MGVNSTLASGGNHGAIGQENNQPADGVAVCFAKHVPQGQLASTALFGKWHQ